VALRPPHRRALEVHRPQVLIWTGRRRADWTDAGEGFDAAYDDEQALFIDYVADTGDGFDSTYAVAALLTADHLHASSDGLLPGAGGAGPDDLPRGRCIVFGGDQVYPEASVGRYQRRLETPYLLAAGEPEGEDLGDVLAIPGNHDWYPGLNAFLQTFAGQGTFARRRRRQRRSYFAARLRDDLWLWGLDLPGDGIDPGQRLYFERIRDDEMAPDAAVVLCIPDPTWHDGGAPLPAGVLELLGGAGRPLPLVLSGDLHHYARYSGDGTQYITCGTGGAYLAPTHQLPSTVGHDPTLRQLAVYPSAEESSALTVSVRRFIERSLMSALTLGALYLLILWSGQRDPAGALFHLTAGIPAALTLGWAVFRGGWRGAAAGSIHVAAHAVAILTIGGLGVAFLALLDAAPWGDAAREVALLAGWMAALAVATLSAGFIAGAYLHLTYRRLGIHLEEAFVSQAFTDYKGFLRLRIGERAIEGWYVACDRVPDRWVPDTGARPALMPPDGWSGRARIADHFVLTW
jgi:hypothetical protein